MELKKHKSPLYAAAVKMADAARGGFFRPSVCGLGGGIGKEGLSGLSGFSGEVSQDKGGGRGVVGSRALSPLHGCCWETFCIFAYCGL